MTNLKKKKQTGKEEALKAEGKLRTKLCNSTSSSKEIYLILFGQYLTYFMWCEPQGTKSRVSGRHLHPMLSAAQFTDAQRGVRGSRSVVSADSGVLSSLRKEAHAERLQHG